MSTPPRSIRASVAQYAPIVVTTAVITMLLWPLAFPGWFGLRDMVVVYHPAPPIDLIPRNSPQDDVLALIATVVPATIVVRLLLVAAALAGAYCAARWADTPAGRVSAIVVCLYNPFVIERLLQGHWSLVIAAWLLPGVAWYREKPWRQLFLVCCCSLTPTGAVVAAVVAVWTGRRKALLVAGSVLCFLPWLRALWLVDLAGQSTTDVFLARAEFLALPLSLLSLGGIWNTEALPASRGTILVILGVMLAPLMLRAPRRLQILALLGYLGTLALSTFPSLLSLPGLVLFRDSHKLVMFMIPAMVAGVVDFLGTPARQWLIGTAVAGCMIAQTPDAPATLAQMKPHTSALPPKENGVGLLMDSQIVSNDAVTMVNPWLKNNSMISNGQLVVDQQVIDPVDPRWERAAATWRATGEVPEGFAYVVHDNAVVARSEGVGRNRRSLPILWLVVGLGLSIGALREAKK